MDQTKRLISVFDCHQWYTVKNTSFCYCGRAWFSSLIVPERLSVVLFLWAVVYSFVSMFPRSSWVCFIPLFIAFEVLVFIILFHATGNRITSFSCWSYSSSKDPTRLMVLIWWTQIYEPSMLSQIVFSQPLPFQSEDFYFWTPFIWWYFIWTCLTLH